jgi:hypothetical protein
LSLETKIFSPNGNLGYGFPVASLEAGLRERPDMIGADGGSTDAGPYYLGAGVSFTGRQAVKRDLRLLLLGARELQIPLVVGSCGGGGGEPHLEWTAQILEEIAAEEGLHFRLGLIHAEQDREAIRAAHHAGKVAPLDGAPPLSDEAISAGARIVAQMGYEPIQNALEDGADVILAGRACDVSIYAAVPTLRGCDVGLSIHAAKIVECGAFCAVPSSATDCMLVTIRDDDFIVRALNPDRRVTAASAAAHSLYEQPHPSRIVEPIGVVDLESACFDELDDGSVCVSGSKFAKADKYTVKLEGVSHVGYRAVSFAGVKDPVAAQELESCLEAARTRVADAFGAPGEAHAYQMFAHTYGANGGRSLGSDSYDTMAEADAAVVLEVVAEEQEIASQICSLARSTMLHHNYPGRIAVGGNLALLFSPHDVAWGAAYEFTIYHVWEVTDPLAPFPIEFKEL